MTKPDPTLAQIAAQFTRHDVEKSGGGYLILDRRTSNPVARLRPILDTDRFELFYWSNVSCGRDGAILQRPCDWAGARSRASPAPCAPYQVRSDVPSRS